MRGTIDRFYHLRTSQLWPNPRTTPTITRDTRTTVTVSSAPLHRSTTPQRDKRPSSRETSVSLRGEFAWPSKPRRLRLKFYVCESANNIVRSNPAGQRTLKRLRRRQRRGTAKSISRKEQTRNRMDQAPHTPTARHRIHGSIKLLHRRRRRVLRKSNKSASIRWTKKIRSAKTSGFRPMHTMERSAEFQL